ncbi:MAG: electron transfer flavoprotein subunit alpha/FixB family protein [Chitinophagaceae bacterium]|nr:electron transfer flavoprotein subunit alpha/FixB family protein [Oligoflexus sp.]
MMKVLVFIEQRENTLKKASLEALSVARNLAGSSANVAAVVIGGSIDSITAALKGHGADTVYSVSGAGFENYNVLNYAAAIDSAIKTFSPTVVLGMASPMGRDVFPRLAARHDAGIATDLIELKAEGETLVGLKPMYAGKAYAEVTFQNTKIQFATLRANVFKADATDGSAAVTKLDVTAADSKLKTVEIRKDKSAKVDLTEAGIIISGGRALGSADAFKILNEAADVLGATVGASRAAVDAGYASHEMQVGQTGKTVNPNLYIAAGISGSIQHMAGMRTSKVIVAINTDPEAPIFKIANYGIVGDLFQVIPILTQKLKELRG